MRFLLTAAGAMRRWTLPDGSLYGGVPKHLIPIDGEPLIHRTARLLAPHGEVIVVGPDDDRYRAPGASLHVPTHHVPWVAAESRHDADKFLSSRELWSADGRTTIVHGDTYLTEQAISRIVARPDPSWCLFARYHRHHRPFHKLETLALTFVPADHVALDEALARIVQLQERGSIPRSGTWDLYRALRGASVRELRKITRLSHHELTPGHSVEIGPPSTDLDRPAEYEGLMTHLGLEAVA